MADITVSKEEWDRVIEILDQANKTVESVKPQWISVKERLPEETPAKCLCFCKDGYMVGTYTNWGWMFPCYFGPVTHWMSLPEPPQEGGGEDG